MRFKLKLDWKIFTLDKRDKYQNEGINADFSQTGQLKRTWKKCIYYTYSKYI